MNDIIYQASKSPGPGQYNPRNPKKEEKSDKKNYIFWINKHKSPSPLVHPHKVPPVG